MLFWWWDSERFQKQSLVTLAFEEMCGPYCMDKNLQTVGNASQYKEAKKRISKPPLPPHSFEIIIFIPYTQENALWKLQLQMQQTWPLSWLKFPRQLQNYCDLNTFFPDSELWIIRLSLRLWGNQNYCLPFCMTFQSAISITGLSTAGSISSLFTPSTSPCGSYHRRLHRSQVTSIDHSFVRKRNPEAADEVILLLLSVMAGPASGSSTVGSRCVSNGNEKHAKIARLIVDYSQLSLKRTPSGPKLLSGLERCLL